jgi:hypothetical protein
VTVCSVVELRAQSRRGLLGYCSQFVLVLELLGPSKYGAPDKPGDNLMSKSLGNEKVRLRICPGYRTADTSGRRDCLLTLTGARRWR